MQQKSIEWNRDGGSSDGWRGKVVGAGGARGPTPLAWELGFLIRREKKVQKEASGGGVRRREVKRVILPSGSPGKGAEVRERASQSFRVSAPCLHRRVTTLPRPLIFISCRLIIPLR